mgnify:CR=1 FL=1
MKFATKIGIFLFFIKGWMALSLVSKPIFSAFAIASSVVPTWEDFFLNSIKSFCFSKFLHKGWSTDTAKKVAPNIVSGLVVKTFTFFSFPSIF